ncbi:MAG: electron transfer flavoprotein subunit alpha/FixB family protein [Proteobacteria bacterium]|nr:MAG: electron transfer flavoprotein subunit alpha/FixB family protein [Pseudomonadota bacterium]TDJ70070.1 MAG: electron transfer flavoprotein subunit alpha/FixB family protein [Pseudomonadota bacterium]
MAVLVLAEHNNTALNPATLNTVAAATRLSDNVDILVAGAQCSAAASAAAKVAGIGKVLVADAAHFDNALAENVAPLIVKLAEAYSHILAAATTAGKNIMPRAAALMDVAQISEIIAVESESTFKRPIYAGNIIATVESTDAKRVITVRTTAFDPVADHGGNATIENVDGENTGLSQFVGEDLTKSDRPELAAADIIVSGGRGVGSAENFAIIEALADKLGAAVGASRAAVDAGYVPNDYQVGQTGKVVAPTLYIAIGISGAIQHLAGMKDSKLIVAINKDAEAPIFGVADYGLVGDLFKEVPNLIEALDQ